LCDLGGIAYCLFAINFICLFFANVAEGDQADWMISAGISLAQDFVIIPAVVGFVVTLLAMVFLACVACAYGVKKEHLTKTGRIAVVQEVFNSNSDKQVIKRALAELPEHTTMQRRGQRNNPGWQGRRFVGDGHGGEEEWDDFEVFMSHDVACVDLSSVPQPSVEVAVRRKARVS